MVTCLVGLGSNLGDRTDNLQRALGLLGGSAGRLLTSSSWHQTRPVGGPAGQEDFCNAAALVETNQSPAEVLQWLQGIERQLGRQRVERWGPRSLDLDLLLYGDLVLHSPTLVVPHPRLAFRRFVLTSAVEIAGEMFHPPTQFSLRELLARLDRAPIHLAVVGREASAIGRAAAQQVQAAFLASPVLNRDGVSAYDRVRELLASAAHSWDAVQPSPARVIVSDYWIGWDDAENATAAEPPWSVFPAAWSALPQQLVSPHLVVCCEPFVGTSVQAWEHRRQMVVPGEQFPVLTLRNITKDAAVAEVTAAVEAMRP